MLKILQARVHQYMNQDLQMFNVDLENAEEPENKLLDHRKSKRVQKKKIYFCFTDYAKAFDHADHSKLWKICQEMRQSDHLNCLL